MRPSPPPWQEPPVFTLPNVTKRVILSHPSALAVVVHGIDGEIAPQLFDSFKPEFITGVHKFKYDPLKIVDEHASPETVTQVAIELVKYLEGLSGSGEGELFMLFAYDLGGVIIEEAIIIASRREHCKILERTCLIVFYGTAHCSSEAQTLQMNLLSLLHFCFKGLLGPWVPAFIDRFSDYQQRLIEQFKMLASNLRVINIAQGLSPSSPHKLITHSTCAKCGLGAEERTMWDRSHYLLGSLLGYQQQSFMERKLLNAIICHWQAYKDFLAVLGFNPQGRTTAPASHGNNNNMLLEYFLSLPETQRWMWASVPKPIHVELDRLVYSDGFFDSFEFHVASTNERSGDFFLRLDAALPNSGVATEAQLYARLCTQLLQQQPSLILWVRHLYPNLRDAVIGSDRKWRTRCLMRCLRTLLLTPKDGIVYCLVHCGPTNASRNVISQLVAVTQESEIPFRLLISTEIELKVKLGNETPCTRVRLDSGEAIHSMYQDHEILVQKLIERQPSLEPDKRTILDALNSGMNVHRMNLLTNILDLGSLESLPVFPRLNLHSSPIERVSGCAENGMPWVIPVVAWVKHAIRPLSHVELKRILEIEWSRQNLSSIHDNRPSGEILFANLQRMLPELLWIRGDMIILRQDFEKFGQMWSRHHSSRDCPDKYIAKVCLNNIDNAFLRSIQETIATGDDEAEATRDYFDGVLSKYAARYWMEHYYLASPNLVVEDASFRSMLKERWRFKLDSWVQYLASIYWSSGIGEDMWDKASPQTLERVFALSLLESAYLSYRIVTLPLSLEDNFDHLLLGIAREIVAESKYYNMVQVICKDLSQGHVSGTLTRVIAAAPENQITPLFAAHDAFLREYSIQTLLTSIAVGNISAVRYLLVRTPVVPFDQTQAGGPSYLGTPLQVACEYGDSEVVAEILNSDNPWFSLERSFPWNALHVTCQLAWGDIVAKLSHLKWSCSYNPLVITSGHSLLNISKSLADSDGLCVNTGPPGDEGCSPIKLASKYGFLNVLEWLIDSQHCELSPENHENRLISLALRSGSEKVATRVLQALLGEHLKKVPPGFFTTYSDDSDDSDWSSESSENSYYSYGPMVSNTWQEAGLIDAVQCGSSEAVLDILLNTANSNARDLRARTLLILAAMNGSIGLLERLLKAKASLGAKDNNGRTAMHHACEQGHMSVVEALTKNSKLYLVVQDKSLHTPVSAAIRAGHQHIVMFLLPKMTYGALKTEFLLTAGNGQQEMLDRILEFATDLDSNAQEDFVNAKDWKSRTVLHQAASSNYPRIVQFLLLRRTNLEAKDLEGMTPLADAAALGHSSLQCLKLLLDAGASTEVMNRRGLSPLIHAIFEEKEAVVQLLLDKGAKPQLCRLWSNFNSLLHFTMTHSSLAVLQVLLGYFDKVMKSGSGPLPEGIPTPTKALQSAIEWGNVRTLDALIGIWKDFDDTIYDDTPYEARDEIGTILHYAARYGSLANMKWVWVQPNIVTDVNTVVGYYGTPLQAAIQGNIDVDEKVTCLLEWGAEVSREGGQSGTALNAAAALLKVDVAKAILDCSKEGDMNFVAGQWGSPIEAVLSRDKKRFRYDYDVEARDMMDILISKGVSAALRGGFWHTALHAAAHSHSLSIVNHLLKQKGVSKDERDLMGRLPLHLAATRGNWEMVNELSSGKSTIMSEDYQGRNVLHIAAGLGHLSVINRLLENARVTKELINKTDHDGWTPLHWSCRSPRKDVVELLLSKGASKTARTTEKRWYPIDIARYHCLPFSDDLKVDGVVRYERRAYPSCVHCECCHCDIYGTRYKCVAEHVYCGYFNLCFKCYRHVSTIHFKGHNFRSMK